MALQLLLNGTSQYHLLAIITWIGGKWKAQQHLKGHIYPFHILTSNTNFKLMFEYEGFLATLSLINVRTRNRFKVFNFCKQESEELKQDIRDTRKRNLTSPWGKKSGIKKKKIQVYRVNQGKMEDESPEQAEVERRLLTSCKKGQGRYLQ